MPSHRAAWIFPVDAPPVQDGVLTISGGWITSVEPYRGQAVDQDHGAAALIPGLVNAHVHLDLGGLRGTLPPPTSFTDWLTAVIDYRRSSSVEEWDAAITAGIHESLQSGVTLVGDISVGGRSAALLRSSLLRGVVFYELLSLNRARAEQVWQSAREWLRLEQATDSVRLGLSPHAPYTVHRWLLEQAVAHASLNHLPLAMHLGETRAEWELLEKRQGPFRPFLERLGVWDDSGLASSLQELIDTMGRHQPSLIAHGNYFTPKAYSHLGSSVVYCPRTHAYFRHPPHPFREMLHTGINVALGTDSLASNPDLSLWAELRFLAGLYPDLPGETLLRMGTFNGALALGFAERTGSLAPGKVADFLVVDLPQKTTGADVHRLLWVEGSRVRAVFVGGNALPTAGATP